MNWGQLITLFHSYLGQDQASPTYFSDDAVRVFMHKALRRVNGNCKLVRKRQAINITAGTSTYDLPSDCHEVFRVAYDGARIDQYSQARLNADNTTWRTATGEPYLWYVDRLDNQIGLYPEPSVSSTVTGASQEDGVPVLMGDTEDGIIIDITTDDGFPLGEDGVPVLEITANHLEVYYWGEPADFHHTTNPDVPQWAQHFLLYSALSEAFRVGLPDQDLERAAAWAVMAGDLEERMRIRSANVIPKVHRSNIGQHPKHRSIQQRFPATIGDV